MGQSAGLRLLKEYVRLLTEEAATSQTADQQGFALFKTKAYEGQALILYDPKKLVEATKSDEGFDVGVQYLTGKGLIVGYVRYVPHNSDCMKAFEIQSSAAIKGFGPLMYDIAMSLSPGGIISDRNKTSKAAQGVWGVYDTKRNDVISRPLDNKDSPKTKPKIDDCELSGDKILDKAYRGAHVDTGSLEKRHVEAMRAMERMGHKRVEVEGLLREAGQNYFETRNWTG